MYLFRIWKGGAVEAPAAIARSSGSVPFVTARCRTGTGTVEVTVAWLLRTSAYMVLEKDSTFDFSPVLWAPK